VELTNQHKLLLGVAGVGVMALLVDRLVLTNSAPAQAGAAASVPAAPAATPQPSAPAGTVDGAADRLQRLAGAVPASPENEAKAASAFTAPVGWLPEADRASARVAGATRSTREAELSDRFRLTSVFTIGPGYATISGEKIAVGQTSEKLGLKLLSIQPPAHRGPAVAVVEHRGQQVRLETQYGVSKSGVRTQK
jgi:hypothetical protein